MNAQEALIIGIAHCIVPKEEIPVGPRAILSPLIEQMLKNQKLQSLPSTIIHQSPSIVQVIIPVASEKIITPTVVAPTTTIPTTTTTMSITTTDDTIIVVPTTKTTEETQTQNIPSVIEPLLASIKAERETERIGNYVVDITTPMPSTTESLTTIRSDLVLEQMLNYTTITQATETPLTTSSTPFISTSTTEEQKTTTDSTINVSTDETYSKILNVLVSTEKTQHLLEPEEPPEYRHDDIVPNN